jgi:uncharacterized protein
MKSGSALLFSIAIVISAWMFSGSWKNTHHTNDVITVKGMAKKDFTSDLIIWDGSFSEKSATMQEAYAKIKTDAEKVKNYLVGKGVNEKNITFSAINIGRDYNEERDKEGNYLKKFAGFELNQSVTVESGEIEKIEVISREITELINQGIELDSKAPQYTSTKLAELKHEMLAEATKDAKMRAEKISENAGARLGKLRRANMGIFQITGRNSSESYSYGGSYNTSSKEKTASITVNLEFGVE